MLHRMFVVEVIDVRRRRINDSLDSITFHYPQPQQNHHHHYHLHHDDIVEMVNASHDVTAEDDWVIVVHFPK